MQNAMAHLVRIQALLSLSLLYLTACVDGVEISVPRATATGPCCEECSNTTVSACLTQYPPAGAQPCTLALCEYDASLAVDGNVSTSVRLQATDMSAIQAGITSSLTLDLGIVSARLLVCTR